MRIKIIFEYDGSEFFGYQRQPNPNTIQQVMEEAIAKATGESTVIVSSGRTDSGVSAMNAVAHFDTATTIPPCKIALAVNQFLPSTIRIKRSQEVDEKFHSRFDAKAKTYLYQLYQSEIDSPLRRNSHARYSQNLDICKMREQMQFLLGEHDFTSFMASGGDSKNTVRTIYSLSLIKKGDELHFCVTGSGFLYNMVRIIVGTLLDIGLGKLSLHMKDILLSKDRTKAGATAPANGLLLVDVMYEMPVLQKK